MSLPYKSCKAFARRYLPAVAAVIVLTSCAAVNLAYEHADWWMERMATKYVDLDAKQEEALRAKFEELHAWHRTHELPQYATLLDRAADRMQQGLTRADVTWFMNSVNERWEVTSEQLSNELSPVLVTLKPNQIVQIADNLARENSRFAKSQIDLDPKKRERQRTEWLTDQVQKWVGELTPQQRQRIATVAPATPEFPEMRLVERRRRQAQFLKLVSEQHDPLTLQTAIARLLFFRREGASDGYRKSVARYEAEITQMVLDIDRTLSREQRATAVTRLRKFAGQFRTLASGRS